MKRPKFKTVEEYYEYMSQGNAFAPRYADLVESAKEYWRAEFGKTIQKG